MKKEPIAKHLNFGHYVWDLFSGEECKEIISLYREDEEVIAEVGLGKKSHIDSELRITTINWLYPEDETTWIFDRLEPLVNKRPTALQFSCYREGHYYNWHVDRDLTQGDRRETSIVVQLNDGYEGGNLEFKSGNTKAPKKPGTVIMFNTSVLHRVSPVTRGKRFSLVVWL